MQFLFFEDCGAYLEQNKNSFISIKFIKNNSIFCGLENDKKTFNGCGKIPKRI